MGCQVLLFFEGRGPFEKCGPALRFCMDLLAVLGDFRAFKQVTDGRAGGRASVTAL